MSLELSIKVKFEHENGSIDNLLVEEVLYIRPRVIIIIGY